MVIKNLRDQESLAEIRRYVEGLLERNTYSPNRPLSDGSPFTAYRNYVENVSKALATGQGLAFTALQTHLKATNPVPVGGGKLYDPLTPLGPPPGGMGFKTDSLDVPIASMNPGSDRIKREDRLKYIEEGTFINKSTGQRGFTYPDGKTIKEKRIELNQYDEGNKFDGNSYIDTDQPENTGVNGMKSVEIVPGVSVQTPDYSRIFNQQTNGPDFGDGQRGGDFFAPQKSQRKRNDDAYNRRVRAQANLDTFFHKKDVEKGYVEQADIEEVGALFGDDDLYVPFYLEDLRKQGRRVYFRAFLKNLRETFSPEWNTETFYGRTDPVGTYRGTSRSFNISFMMAAMSPEGFTAMWRKINNLTKMVYPMTKDGIMTKAPVIRMKIGDMFADAGGAGLSGYISSPIEFDYTDMPWEISSFNGPTSRTEVGKAPQVVNISFTFQVIHEVNPALDENYVMNTSFRTIGSLEQEEFTSDMDFTTESTDSNGETP